MRRNPRTTTAGGSRRKTRASVLAKRQRGVVSIAVVSDGVFAKILFEMNNGDTIEYRAPSLYAAIRVVGDMRGRHATLSRMTINGTAWSPKDVIAEAARLYGRRGRDFINMNNESVRAWRELSGKVAGGMKQDWVTELVGNAVDHALRGEYSAENVIPLPGIINNHAAIFMAAVADVTDGNVQAIGNPYDDWASDADALMINAQMHEITIFRDSDGYHWTSLDRYNRRYEGEP